MGVKRNEMKFTILFNPGNPGHVFAANKLNMQSRNNKATYISQAIMFFEERAGMDADAIRRIVTDIIANQTAPVQEPCVDSMDYAMNNTVRNCIKNSLSIFQNG